MNRMLTLADYPPQEPIPPKAELYRAEALRRSAGVEGQDFPYGDDIYQRVALFVPPRPNGTVLAYMHGGGWVSGYKEMLAFMAPALMEANIVFASVGYRLAPAHVFPAGYEDGACAIKWLHENIARFGGDPNRLFVGGHSAGGHYASLLALRSDWRTKHALPGDVIKGCWAVSGVYDLTGSGGLTVRPRFLGPTGTDTDRQASPILNINASPPQFLMAHGDDDFPHLMKQAELMEGALRHAGGEVERIVLPGCDHFGSSLATADPALPLQRRAIEWMSTH